MSILDFLLFQTLTMLRRRDRDLIIHTIGPNFLNFSKNGHQHCRILIMLIFSHFSYISWFFFFLQDTKDEVN